jgi:hypothetical protein
LLSLLLTETLAVGTLAVVVIQPSGLALLVAGIGGPVLAEAAAGATGVLAVALASITTRTDVEYGLTIRGVATKPVQDDVLAVDRVGHAFPGRSLDNSESF